jgi:hypothetical protein
MPRLELVALQALYTFWTFLIRKARPKLSQKVLRLGPIRMGSLTKPHLVIIRAKGIPASFARSIKSAHLKFNC